MDRKNIAELDDVTYFEDISIGDSREYEDYRLEQDEIISFGKQYTPHPVHTNPDAAETSPYGSLIASGIQTIAIAMRQIVEHDESLSGTLGGTGIDDLRWYKPIRPGDTLSVNTNIVNKKPYHNDFGIVDIKILMSNQKGELVMNATIMFLFARKNSS